MCKPLTGTVRLQGLMDEVSGATQSLSSGLDLLSHSASATPRLPSADCREYGRRVREAVGEVKLC